MDAPSRQTGRRRTTAPALLAALGPLLLLLLLLLLGPATLPGTRSGAAAAATSIDAWPATQEEEDLTNGGGGCADRLPASTLWPDSGQAPEPPPVSDRCLFILGTGRSGSTQLMDAVNQLPNFYIQGEQFAAFYHLYEFYRSLQRQHAHFRGPPAAGQHIQPPAAAALAAASSGALPAASSSMHASSSASGAGDSESNAEAAPAGVAGAAAARQALCAIRSTYTLLYGYPGPGTAVTGFKEIRFRSGSQTGTPPPGATYEDFAALLSFLRSLCRRSKVLLNTRRSWRASDNSKLQYMVGWGASKQGKSWQQWEQERRDKDARFEAFLGSTHAWYDRYAEEHARDGVAMRVLMEDMFDAQVNASLARALVAFLGEDHDRHAISFTRMPSWSTGAPAA